MKITLNQAFQASQKLQKRQYPNGQTEKPPLLNAKGDAGIAIYFLKHAIKDAFKSHFERIQDLRQEKAELLQKQQKNKTGLSAKDAERLDEVESEFTKLNGIEEEIDLKYGKINVDDIKKIADADDLEAIDFAIDFSNKQTNQEAA